MARQLTGTTTFSEFYSNTRNSPERLCQYIDAVIAAKVAQMDELVTTHARYWHNFSARGVIRFR